MKIKKCAYCGVRDGITRDHVIAKAFYDPLKVINAITVPACDPCNNGKSSEERYADIALTLASGFDLTEEQKRGFKSLTVEQQEMFKNGERKYNIVKGLL